MEKCTIIFKPINITIEVVKGTNLMEAARRAGVFLDAPCGGKGHCGKCRVRIESGNHKHQYTPLLTAEEVEEGIRLACLTSIEDDMTVQILKVDVVNDIMVEDITSPSKKKLINRTLDILQQSGIKTGTSFKTIPLILEKPTIDDNIPDWERLLRELKPVVGCEPISCPIEILRKLPTILRKNNNEITLVMLKKENGYEIMNIVGGRKAGMYGLCADIGTTTVAACLVNLDTGI